MKIVTIVARHRTSDFDYPSGPKPYDESEAIERAEDARCAALEYLRGLNTSRGIDPLRAASVLQRKMPEVAKAFWKQWDYDHRFKSIHMKEEAAWFVNGLTKINSARELMSPMFFDAASRKIDQLLEPKPNREKDVLSLFFLINDAFLEVCKDATKESHKKAGIKCFEVGCMYLVDLWEEIAQRKFRGRLSLEAVTSKQGQPTRQFTADSVQFVYVSMRAIVGGNLEPSKVQSALKAILKK